MVAELCVFRRLEKCYYIIEVFVKCVANLKYHSLIYLVSFHTDVAIPIRKTSQPFCTGVPCLNVTINMTISTGSHRWNDAKTNVTFVIRYAKDDVTH